MHYTILNWLFWPCFTWFLGSCDTWFLCCSMPHQAAATCPLTISNSNANGKGSKHGLKLGSKRTSACTNMWKHVIINFWRTWKPTSDASWFSFDACATVQNLGERVLRTAWEALQDSSCPIDLHWCIIGWSHRHLLKAALPSHPLHRRSIHDAARNARASQH